MEIDIPATLDNQFFEDLLVTCLEGGSNYWVRKVRVVGTNGEALSKPRGEPTSTWIGKAVNNHTPVVVTDDDGEEHSLTQEALGKGFAQWFRSHPKAYISSIRPVEADMDADEADCILQYALFGELIYG